MIAGLMIVGIVGIIIGLVVLFLVWEIFGKISAFTQVDVETTVRTEMRTGREEAAISAKALREEVGQSQKQANEVLVGTLNALSNVQKERLTEVTKAINDLIAASRQESGILREKLEAQFKDIQKSNEQKLDEMRKTVDEKLHATLERRLGESFKLISERLEAVHRGLGEMQNLATGVGDLKRVLTNVKARGTWGEIQLVQFSNKSLLLTNMQKMCRLRRTHGNELNLQSVCLAEMVTEIIQYGCQ